MEGGIACLVELSLFGWTRKVVLVECSSNRWCSCEFILMEGWSNRYRKLLRYYLSGDELLKNVQWEFLLTKLCVIVWVWHLSGCFVYSMRKCPEFVPIDELSLWKGLSCWRFCHWEFIFLIDTDRYIGVRHSCQFLNRLMCGIIQNMDNFLLRVDISLLPNMNIIHYEFTYHHIQITCSFLSYPTIILPLLRALSPFPFALSLPI